MTVFTCEDNFDAMMTCVYEAWASRLGHSNIKLKTEPIGNLELFCDYRHVDADPEKTGSHSLFTGVGERNFDRIWNDQYRHDIRCICDQT